MGLTSSAFWVKGPKGVKTVDLIVDTGSVYTRIPYQILERLGVGENRHNNVHYH